MPLVLGFLCLACCASWETQWTKKNTQKFVAKCAEFDKNKVTVTLYQFLLGNSTCI